jgi:hypothetical protein
MSNKTKTAGTRRRHAPQHRKEPSWTVGDLAAMPGGLGAKIVVAGVAGATLALPATSAFASPSAIPTHPGPGLISVTRAAGQPTRFRAEHSRNNAAGGSAKQNMQPGHPTVAASEQADPAGQGPGLLLEPNGTFMTLARSTSNVHTVPAGSLIITSNGIMMRPVSGTYATIYGLITVAQASGSGTPSAAAPALGAVSVNPGGPLQAPPQGQPTTGSQPGGGATLPASAPATPPSTAAPAAFGGGTAVPTPTPAPVVTPTSTPTVTPTPTPTVTSTPIMIPTPVTPPTSVTSPTLTPVTPPTQVITPTPTPVTTLTPAPAPSPVPTPNPGLAASGAPMTAAAPVTTTPATTAPAIAAPVAGTATPIATSTTAHAPVTATATAPPAVQVVSALGGATVADNGTVTPTGSVNLAFPSSGIGGSLPLSLPSAAAPAPAAQPAFPAADQNAVLSDPIFQGLIQSLGQPPAASQPKPILNPLQDVASTAPATAAPAAVQLAANTFGANGNPVMSDASPLPAGLVQTVAQDSATQNTVAQNTVGQSIIPPSQGSILMVQPSIFGSPTIKPLDPGAAMTLSDGTQIQVTDDNRLQITRPNGDLYEVAPGNTYTLPDGSGNQIVVPTVPPVLLQDPGNGDTILAPGSHISVGGGGSIDVTQDGVLRVTTPDGNQVDYAPGSSFTLPGGTTLSVMTPPQAMNLDQNPATQLTAAAGAGGQVAANGFDANGNPIASDASQLPVQLAQNTAGAGGQVAANGFDANGSMAGGGVAPAPADTSPAPAPTDTAPAPAPAVTNTAPAPAATPAPAPAPTDTTAAPAPAPTDVAPAPAPTDVAPAPAPTDVAPAPAPADVAPAPAPSSFTSSDPSTAGDPLGAPVVGGGSGGGGSFGGGSGS